ncbi:MAG: bifunctional metallophosphatase/5'-nucleotidase, partial [Firmicutes bacterium]|nr:bifunctional metallophosphatase/5'-nucleotidase [Bacillota bacterium]
IYAIAGDMFRGSIIDQEYLGISTIDMINLMKPDVVSLGNHEVDYGLAHLLFLEKCADFPIINADLFITVNNKRLFAPYINVMVDGVKILFIGILTQEVLSSTKSEKIIGSYVNMKRAAKEIGVICDNYRTTDTDLTVLLTHIGYENDLQLAKELKKEYGVDIIIGGHSHTYMDKAAVVNGIPIVQAFTGTDYLGRFDIFYDKENKKIERWNWKCIPIDEDTAENDHVMQSLLDQYKDVTDQKYKRVVTRFERELTHPLREQETEMGNLYADVMADEASYDIMMFGSGSIRKEKMGPIVEYRELLENTPFDDPLWMVEVTGSQFRRMVQHILRDDAWKGETEFYQFSRGVHIKYRKSTHMIEELTFNDKEIRDDDRIKIGLQNYHYSNFDEFMGVPRAEVEENRKPRIVATSVNNIIEEYFATHPGLDAHVEGRIEIVE